MSSPSLECHAQRGAGSASHGDLATPSAWPQCFKRGRAMRQTTVMNSHRPSQQCDGMTGDHICQTAHLSVISAVLMGCQWVHRGALAAPERRVAYDSLSAFKDLQTALQIGE